MRKMDLLRILATTLLLFSFSASVDEDAIADSKLNAQGPNDQSDVLDAFFNSNSNAILLTERVSLVNVSNDKGDHFFDYASSHPISHQIVKTPDSLDHLDTVLDPITPDASIEQNSAAKQPILDLEKNIDAGLEMDNSNLEAHNRKETTQYSYADESEGTTRQGSVVRRDDFTRISISELEMIFQRIAQLESLQEKSKLENSRLADIDNSDSLLDVLSEQVKRYVVTRLTPKTDRECTFNFSRMRCEPKCECKFDFQLGDYWPTRMCRKIPDFLKDPKCSPEREDASDDPVFRRLREKVQKMVKKVVRTYRENLAAPTDSDCKFDLLRFRCLPDDICAYRFKMFDLTPSQSCRLRKNSNFEGFTDQEDFEFE